MGKTNKDKQKYNDELLSREKGKRRWEPKLRSAVFAHKGEKRKKTRANQVKDFLDGYDQ